MTVVSRNLSHRKDYKMTWMMPGKIKGNRFHHVLIAKRRYWMMCDHIEELMYVPITCW